MKLAYYLLLFSFVFITACKKAPGPGGNSQISGHVTINDHTYARAEVTHVSLVNTAALKDEEYILINTIEARANYCIWFAFGAGSIEPDFPDRNIIEVTVNGNEGASGLATKVKAAIESEAAADFTVTIHDDVLTLTHKFEGEVVDGSNGSTPIDVDVRTQGRDGGLLSPEDGVGISVYLTYGDNTIYSKNFSTDPSGNYLFTGLTKGNYTIHAYSKDTVNLSTTIVEVDVEITENLQNVTAPDLLLVK